MKKDNLLHLEANDLAAIIKDVIQTCADCCVDEESRAAILELTN